MITNPNDDALVEQVARALAADDSGPEGSPLFRFHWEEFSEGYLDTAHHAIAVLRPAIRAEALKEAAEVANRAGQEPPTGNLMHDAGWDNATLVISAAILALIDKGGE